MRFVNDPPAPVTVPVINSEAPFAVRRIFCVGRNYADHVREMGGDPSLTPPVFFCKPADALLQGDADFPYPPRSRNVQHEVELVVAIGRYGRDISRADALRHVYGYAVGIDWTRRDLQAQAKRAGEPWDMGKAFDSSASIGAISPAAHVGHPSRGSITLTVNGEVRQNADLHDMLFKVPDILAELSTYVCLQSGDLIYTGTPEGVAAVLPGDVVTCRIEGLGTLTNQVVERR